MRIFYQTLYWIVRKSSFVLYVVSKKLDWLSYKLYDKADFKGAGKRQKGSIF